MNLKNLLLEGTLTPAAKKCLEVVIRQFGKNSFPMIGTYNYRTKRGGKSLSEHAYGNAIDFHVPDVNGFATPDGKQLGDRVKDFLLQNTEELDIQLIIWYREDWARWNDFKKSSYGGQHPHKDHVHVDFIRTGYGDGNRNNKTNINKKNNTFLMNLIGGYYDLSTKNPAGYFKQFKSWNPFSPGIGDNEEGAANKLLKRFDTYYSPKLKEMESSKTTSKEDLQNIQRIREIVDILYQAILDGRSETFDVTYFKFDSSTNSYKLKTMTFKWNYL